MTENNNNSNSNMHIVNVSGMDSVGGGGTINTEPNGGRHSASPARTIDSHDSTTGSMDTIVDRSLNREELQVEMIESSTNTTNAQQQQMQQQHRERTGGSLTNSEIAMLQRESLETDDEAIHAQTLPQQPQQQLDAQSHIYSSPVYDQKPSTLKLTPAALLANVLSDDAAKQAKINCVGGTDADDMKKPKLITHEEFKQQLEEAMATRAQHNVGGIGGKLLTSPRNSNNNNNVNTIDSRISKKQRFPPEFIKYKESGGGGSSSDGDGAGSTLSSKARRKYKASNECCSTFPLQIVLGTLQLMLAISLVALGSLLIVRDAAMSMAGCGIWTGLIAAVTGSLGVVSMRKTQTAFLALSLVCIATSTLALAISGVGLTRDLNRMAEEKEQVDIMNTNNEISAACGLIFALFLHFVVSIVSVYRCALQICTR